MRYQSTRGQAPELGFDDVLLTGLARDGGLYLPVSWPERSIEDWHAMRGLPYAQLATAVTQPFLAGSAVESQLPKIMEAAYSPFDHPAVAPMIQLDSNTWLLELFHGPTLAFKDYALQVVGHLFDGVLSAKRERITIVGATSGDTGSAAIAACAGREAVDIIILHPKGRVSEVQRRQMTTVDASNVHNVAIDGTFDDCQALVKAMFNDQAFRDDIHLSAVNSINWARIMAQTVYYASAALSLGGPDRPVAFAVPTGNFGNVFAGYCAARMGLPIASFLVGSNRNDILTRYFETGAMTVEGVEPSLSPAMDIQVSSNFERLLFEAYGRDGAAVKRLMDGLLQSGSYTVDAGPRDAISAQFKGSRLDDAGIKAVIQSTYEAIGQLIDPHTAIGVHAAQCSDLDSSIPKVVMATAHPAKFPDAVEAATGVRPDLPASLANLYDLEERCDELPNDLNKVQDYVRAHSRV
ncbi:MAG: threonine synthase [Alphaproteobacteria bacterium]|nr:threonine synthase [Alphaproteobacteria bacterium]